MEQNPRNNSMVRTTTAPTMIEGSMKENVLPPEAWAVVNSANHVKPKFDWSVFTVDADKLAMKIKNPKSVNLVLLGYAMAVISVSSENSLFCSIDDVKKVLENRLADKKEMLGASIEAIETGYFNRNPKL